MVLNRDIPMDTRTFVTKKQIPSEAENCSLNSFVHSENPPSFVASSSLVLLSTALQFRGLPAKGIQTDF